MSDTPLTDREVAMSAWLGSGPLVHAEFAKRIERKCNDALAEAAKWEQLHDQDTDHLVFLQARDRMGPTETLNETAQRLHRERDEALAQMCQAVGHLSTIAEDCEAWLNSESDEPSVDFIKAVRDYAKKASA